MFHNVVILIEFLVKNDASMHKLYLIVVINNMLKYYFASSIIMFHNIAILNKLLVNVDVS